MDKTTLLLRAYYETLYDRLAAKRNLLVALIERLLEREVKNQCFDIPDDEKYAAYRDTCVAFVDERLEAYNPIGIQYTFDRIRAKEAMELELQLNWYDSTAEFEALMEAARKKVETGMSEERICELADELIHEAGAFPDKSIMSAYEAEPALSKLPDYIVALAIEQVITEQP